MAERRLEQAARATRDHVELGWDEARVELLLQRTKARARRRSLARVTLAAAAVIALGVGAWWASPLGRSEAPPIAGRPAAAPADDRVIHLGDGSIVTLLDDDADVVVVRVSDDEILLDLTRGAARFDVVPGLSRAFAVTAGEVRVAVVGTVFEVERAGSGASVRVIEGRVRVTWPPDGQALLGAGEDELFPRAAEPANVRGASPATSDTAEAPSAEVASAEVASAEVAHEEPRLAPRRAPRRAQAAPRRAPRPPPAWVALAERGEYREAARRMEEDGALDGADLDRLLLASDTMRLSGRPERALTYLDRAAAIGTNDPRAPLVAFTRGRLLLTGLSRPREAADAFATARALASDGALAMDAAAREVEALAQAGDAEAARARAEEYVQRYPNGLRIDAVRRWGGLSAP